MAGYDYPFAAMRVLAYVSDEMYVAIADVTAEFVSRDGAVTVLRSSPRGASYGELAPGSYRVTLSRQGFGAKIVDVNLGADPHQFRLLSPG